MVPCIFISHGAGLPHVYLSRFNPLKSSLLKLGSYFSQENNKPTKILIISGHNENSPSVRVTSVEKPEKHQFYRAEGDPELAKRVQTLLEDNEISCDLEIGPQLDYGAYCPLMVVFPKADIPVVSLSLHESLNPELHLNIGKALQPLRDEGVLIIGSGMSYHNLSEVIAPKFFGKPKGYEWDQTLTEVITNPDPDQRNEKLKVWKKLPGARDAHPREDHLMPLLVVSGAGGSDVGCQYASFKFMAVVASGYSFP